MLKNFPENALIRSIGTIYKEQKPSLDDRTPTQRPDVEKISSRG